MMMAGAVQPKCRSMGRAWAVAVVRCGSGWQGCRSGRSIDLGGERPPFPRSPTPPATNNAGLDMCMRHCISKDTYPRRRHHHTHRDGDGHAVGSRRRRFRLLLLHHIVAVVVAPVTARPQPEKRSGPPAGCGCSGRHVVPAPPDGQRLASRRGAASAQRPGLVVGVGVGINAKAREQGTSDAVGWLNG